jgi:hypothetical protein
MSVALSEHKADPFVSGPRGLVERRADRRR